LRDFGATYEEFRNRQQHGDIVPVVEGLVQEILCGRYVNWDGEDIIVQPDGRRVDLANSSSGQQEALPVTIMLSAMLWAGRCNCYLEEPEAHIFPSAQKKMVDLIGTVFNLTERQVHFTLTTHSPYILTAFNNLLQAGSLAEQSNKAKDKKRLKALEKIVPRNRWLKPSQVAAYFVADGKAESIMDKETGLINAAAIDGVSDEIAVEFDKLLEL
jgi:predicted ATP-binding protein involved in virulence